jgi:hypothetical protein
MSSVVPPLAGLATGAQIELDRDRRTAGQCSESRPCALSSPTSEDIVVSSVRRGTSGRAGPVRGVL